MPQPEEIAQGLLQFTALVISISFHEAAHVFAAWRLGDDTGKHLGRLTLNPLAHLDPIGTVVFPLLAIFLHVPIIGWGRPAPVNPANFRNPSFGMVITAAAGPFSNVMLAIAGACATLLIFATGIGAHLGKFMEPVARFLLIFMMLNLILALFNLLPLMPLDGGRIAAGLGPRSMADALNASAPYTMLILYGLTFVTIGGRSPLDWFFLPAEWVVGSFARAVFLLPGLPGFLFQGVA